MTLLDCPECGRPLDMVLAQDGADDTAEVMDVYCPKPDGCGWESVDPQLGDAVVEP